QPASMSARTRLPPHLVPARQKTARQPQFIRQQQLASLESMLNRTVLSVQRATHRDILELGDRYVSADDRLPAVAEPVAGSRVDIDSLLQQAQAEFDRDLRNARESLRKELEAERERALAEQKAEFEKHLDQVCSLRDKAEDMAKRDLRRACELDKQAALRQQREYLDTVRLDAIERARMEERHLARQNSAADRAEAVQKALDEAEVAFERREQHTVDKTKKECRQLFNEELTAIRKRHREEVESWMIKYNDLYKNFEHLLDTSRNVEGEFQSLQTDYKRFLDYSDGHFHSDYMMKLKQACLDAASDIGRSLAPSPAPASVSDWPPSSAKSPTGISPNRQRLSVLAAAPPAVRRRRDRPATAVSTTENRPRLTKNVEVYTEEEDVF
uniref:FAM184 domain-containing protein n=2 Tax=Macrostomum lignano TaxID=282301 RepID=A0A1I8H0I1_9PLAT